MQLYQKSQTTKLITLCKPRLPQQSKGVDVDVVLLDFAKAFDKVNHRRLKMKLHINQINEGVTSWIATFFF